MPDMIYDIANYLHVLASLALLMKIWTLGCAGLSAKSQLLYVLVYTTRYLDLLFLYDNTALKITYLLLGYCTVLAIFLFRKSYERKYDTFRIELLIIPCLAIAMLINHGLSVIEVLWTFSIYLEAVAMVPQFIFIAKAKYIHKHIFYYLLALGIYKAIYLVHWIYRYYDEHHYDELASAGAVVQLLLYCDFFVRVFPKLEQKPSDTDDKEERASDDKVNAQAAVENGNLPKNGPVSCNIILTNCTIIFKPPCSTAVNDDKENLLKSDGCDKITT